MPSLPRALIFDVDGTLAETEESGHRIAFNRAFADAGLVWDWDPATYVRLLAIAGGRERIADWCAEADRARLDAPDFDGFVRDLHRRKTAHYLALLARGEIGLRPGVLRLMREARARGSKLAVATTTSAVNLVGLVEKTLGGPPSSWFDAIGDGDRVPVKKPAPDVYRFVLDELGLEPGEAVAIEDSAIGARAAIAAGVAVLVTRSAYTREDRMPPGLLADLDGLGDERQTASGIAASGPWRGVVGLDAIADWVAALRPAAGSSDPRMGVITGAER